MSNKKTYGSPNVVREYVKLEGLQKPEQAILNIIKAELGDARMLDIGVGGGRTTLHFAGLVKEYVGIDFSERMIEACKGRFVGLKNASFRLADARSLHGFKENCFDFVLFSFNGLDYVNREERIIALEEIRRVCREGGIFAFSTHNIAHLDRLYHMKFTINPLKMAWRIFRCMLLLLLNGRPGKMKGRDWVLVNDGVHRFGLKTYYTRPEAQIKQLRSTGFREIRLFALEDGREIIGQPNNVADPWIYYLCRK